MNRRLLLIVLATGLTSFLSTYLASSVNLALKSIGTEFVANPSDLSLLAAVYLLLTSLCLVPFGKLSDIYGPKRTLVFGCAFFTVSNLIVPFLAHNFTLLVICRGLQGIGAAFLLVSNTPIITAIIPKEYRTTALGFLSGLVYFGYSVGNFIGGALTEAFGWRSIFISAAVGGAIAFIAIQLLVPKDAKIEKEARSVDYIGIVFYATALICLQLGSNRITDMTGIALLVACVAALALFLRRQFTVANPIYDVRLFTSNSVFAMSNLAVFFNFMATYGSQYLLPLYLQCNRGLSPIEAGKILLLQPLMQIFFSPLAGFFADKTSPPIVASLGMGLIAIALFFLAGLTENTPYIIIYGALIFIGIGISFFSAPNTGIIMGAVPANKRGMAAASNSIMRNLGSQCSIIMCGSAFLISMGNVKGIPVEKYGEMLVATKVCYLLFALMCVIGLLISYKRSGRKK